MGAGASFQRAAGIGVAAVAATRPCSRSGYEFRYPDWAVPTASGFRLAAAMRVRECYLHVKSRRTEMRHRDNQSGLGAVACYSAGSAAIIVKFRFNSAGTRANFCRT